jgi:SAM-dependent methyltransferase
VSACAACGADALRPHLEVRSSEGEGLVPTTDRYGAAPGDIFRCAVCGHGQVEPMPAEAELGEAYEEAADEAYIEEEAGQRATARTTLDAIERHTGMARREAKGDILDLGCWTGFLLSEAQARGWRATGVEPSRFASQYARETLGLDVQTASLEHADLPRGAFDAVVMGDVIEHLPDPGAGLRRAAGLLKPRGVLHLALPDAGSGVARALGARWWSVLPTHVHYFTRESLARLLDRNGFAVEEVGTSPKAFTLRYYLGRLGGYSGPLASASVTAAERLGIADRLIAPDFRDRMGVLARVR